MNTKYLVIETIKYNKLKETNISMDIYFTSASVAKWALDEQSITIVGTMRHDRKGIPKELKMLDGREEKSAMYVYSEDCSIMLVSYVDKKKRRKKNIVLRCMMMFERQKTNDVNQIPSYYTNTLKEELMS